MADPGLAEIAFLAAVALAAGTIDAVAGGGGLLTVPALLSVGLPPHAAIATNKGQSVFGSFAALVRFTRAGLVDGRRARLMFPLGVAGSVAGALLVLAIPPATLRPVIVVLLPAVAVFVGFRRPPAARLRARTRRRSPGSRRLRSAPTTGSSARAPAPSSSAPSSGCSDTGSPARPRRRRW
jgi:uncharacterized membrane protein YfcA